MGSPSLRHNMFDRHAGRSGRTNGKFVSRLKLELPQNVREALLFQKPLIQRISQNSFAELVIGRKTDGRTELIHKGVPEGFECNPLFKQHSDYPLEVFV